MTYYLYTRTFLNKYHNLYEGNRRTLFFLKKREKNPKKQDTKSIKTCKPKDCYRIEAISQKTTSCIHS